MNYRNSFKIYALIDPRNDKIFYIGSSIQPYVRIDYHIKQALEYKIKRRLGEDLYFKKAQKIQSIIKNGKLPVLKILKTTKIENGKKMEKFYYDKYIKAGYKLLQNGKRIGNGLHAVKKPLVNYK